MTKDDFKARQLRCKLLGNHLVAPIQRNDQTQNLIHCSLCGSWWLTEYNLNTLTYTAHLQPGIFSRLAHHPKFLGDVYYYERYKNK